MKESSQTELLVAEFRSRTLPKAAWTHEAHLRVGLWHVLRYSAGDALDRLREGIRALNETHGTPNTETSGYHETITLFYLLWIRAFVAASNRDMPLDDLAGHLVATAGNSQLPLQFYSRERLFSAAARRGWLEPDLQPIAVPVDAAGI